MPEDGLDPSTVRRTTPPGKLVPTADALRELTRQIGEHYCEIAKLEAERKDLARALCPIKAGDVLTLKQREAGEFQVLVRQVEMIEDTAKPFAILASRKRKGKDEWSSAVKLYPVTQIVDECVNPTKEKL